MPNLSSQNKQSTRKLGFETLESRDLLSASFGPNLISYPAESNQALVAQENTLNNVKFTMNSVLNTTINDGHAYNIENNVNTGNEVTQILSDASKINLVTNTKGTNNLNGPENLVASESNFQILKNVSLANNYPAVNNYFQKNNYTSFSTNCEVTLNDRKLLFIQADKRNENNKTREVYVYDTKTRELLTIQDWSNLKILKNASNNAQTPYSFNMSTNQMVTCKVVGNRISVQVMIYAKTNNSGSGFVTLASKSYDLLNSNTQSNTGEGNNAESTNVPGNSSTVSSQNYTVSAIKNLSSIESYPKIQKYLRENINLSVSKAYELSLSDRKILFIQASRKYANNSFGEIFTYDTKTKEILKVDSWAELLKRDQLLSTCNCSLDTSNGAPITCEIDGNYAVVTVHMNDDSDRYGKSKPLAYKRYALQGVEAGMNNSAIKYDKYFVNNSKTISNYPVIERYLRNNSYTNVSNSYEILLDDRKFVILQADKQVAGKISSNIFVYDTKTKILTDVETWARSSEILRKRYSISSISFDMSRKNPIECEICNGCARILVYYRGVSETNGRSYLSMATRSFLLTGASANQNTNTGTSQLNSTNVIYGPMPKEYYMNN